MGLSPRVCCYEGLAEKDWKEDWITFPPLEDIDDLLLLSALNQPKSYHRNADIRWFKFRFKDQLTPKFS